MLLSMTGHGLARVERESVSVQSEIRAVNNKHLKVTVSGELPAELHSRLEQVVRDGVSRGSLHVRLQIERKGDSGYRLNLAAIQAYQKQLAGLGPSGTGIPLSALLTLPGVAEGSSWDADEGIEEAVVEAVMQSVRNLNAMRREEGSAMAASLVGCLGQFQRQFDVIAGQAPRVVELFSQRLTERINQLLEKHDVSVQPSDVIREVGIFAERTDIHEELVRLRSHLEQFRQTLESPEAVGRKLDFLVQELLRETNTIGSKANDAAISASVIEMKSLIERMREMIQNVE